MNLTTENRIETAFVQSLIEPGTHTDGNTPD